MRALQKCVNLLPLLVAPLTAQAAFWSPHIGMDYKYWGVVAAEEYKPTFPRLDNAFNVYVGTRIDGFFGIDIGYENSENKTKTQVFEGGEIIFVSPEVVNDSTMIDLRLHTFHGEMNFYWEVYHALDLIFLMGAAYVYPDTHVMHLTDGTWLEYRNKTAPYWSGRFGFAAQYNPIPCFGIKGTVVFDQIKRTDYLGWDQNDQYYDVHPYNMATTFQIGFVYSLSNPRRHPTPGYEQ